MAESLAILSLASNVISFIDFGLKVVSGAQNVRSSIHGTTADIRELELIVEDVRNFNNKVIRQQSSGCKLSEHEQRIQAMVIECENIATELRKEISLLKLKDGRSKSLESCRVALRSIRKQKDIEAQRNRLEDLDKRIRSNLQHALQREENSAITTDLKSIKELQQELGIKYDTKMDLFREEVIKVAQQSRAKDATSQAGQLTSLKLKLDLLEKEHITRAKQTQIIQSLYFPVLRKRWNQIPKADQTSNNWIFDPGLTPFETWLESKDTRDGLFCIEGRAGSGKSTLMKYVSENICTAKSLSKWAAPAELCTASYFFWNSGYEMQKSQLGLFQSLLYQIFRSAPGLIPLVCPDRFHHEAWEISELQAIFERIAAQQTDLPTIKLIKYKAYI